MNRRHFRSREKSPPVVLRSERNPLAPKTIPTDLPRNAPQCVSVDQFFLAHESHADILNKIEKKKIETQKHIRSTKTVVS